MILGLFKKQNEVYSALTKSLEKMESQGVDRVVLTLYESEPSDVGGRFIDMASNHYYPFETLIEPEQKMMLDEKTYTVIALVNKDVGGIVNYDGGGIEVYKRTHIVPFLPSLKNTSNLNYVTEGGVHSGDDLKKYAKDAENDGWTPEAIERRVDEGIREYYDITKKLMQQAGVYDALEKMEQRQYSPFEQMMMAVRMT